MTERAYDVILYGATGFVGKQTVQYFANYVCTSEIRWAIAGRDRQKLESVKAQVGARANSAEILVADSQNQSAVDEMVAQTHVLLNTAGPFALYGTPIVDACVRSRTHYVDITGETPWVKTLITRYHEQAAAEGTRIIPFCGFDSVPSDLGTYLMVRYIQQELGTECTEVKAYFQAVGGFNGGTMASALNLHESGQWEEVSAPFLLNPPGTYSQAELQHNLDPEYPYYDQDLKTWSAPFFMAPVNTRVVRRSKALYNQWENPYGSEFTYQEYMKFDEPLAWFQATGVTAVMGLFGTMMERSMLRPLLKSFIPKPGSGPSEKTMNEGWFRCELLGKASNGRLVRGLIQDQGDPGNRATVKFVCESALTLVLEQDTLPGGRSRGGILTPATGLGDALANRLRQAGMILDIQLLMANC
ncbi:MAG: saccharopine dehydrogenase [Symploca sp. SIO2C1]|nr:saccharopine dehydrogenase [Symploca sp. SIO2C1]